MNEQPVDNNASWRVTLDLREGPGGAVAIYPKEGEDPKADLLARSIAQNAGDKLTSYEVQDDQCLKDLLTRTIKGADVYHLYKEGKFEHYMSVDDVMAHLHAPVEPETDPRAPEPDPVNHPPHYTKGGVECIDAIDAAVADKPGGEAPYVANVIKYVWRYNDKGGVESLRKARWYLDRLISKRETTPEGR